VTLASSLPGPIPPAGVGVVATSGSQATRGRRRPRPWALLITSLVIAALVLSPLLFLVLQAVQAGWAEISRLLLRQLTAELLWNTLRLTTVVTIGCALVGTGAAFAIERTTVPLRRLWSVLVVIPLAIPDFVVGYAWVSLSPGLHGLWGASLVMTLALYPLVYLPVAASLRRTDPALEEAARSLGCGPMETFRRVTLRQIRPGLLGGCLVVALALLAEFGAFEILRFQTFTTTIYAEAQVGFNSPAACALSLVLVGLGLAVIVGELALNRRDRLARVGPQASRPPTRARLGGWTWPVLAGLVGLVGLALGVPLGALGYWLTHSHATTLPGISVLSATVQTASYAAAAAVVTTAAAIPIALLAVRHRSRVGVLVERSIYLVQCLPGLVIALSLVFFSIRYLFRFYQTPELLVAAYTILFFPLALICVLASVAQAPVGLTETSRSLGVGRFESFRRVTLPLIAPGLAAGACLVFLSAVTELTATLILIPTDTHTLATQFWAYQTNASYGAAAPFAAMLVGIAVIPSYVLARWFDRRRDAAPPTGQPLELPGGPVAPGSAILVGLPVESTR
jgi:iron(III) transport system permease protein